MSLAVEVISFLDILIAVGKIGRGREEGRSCHVTVAHPYSQVCLLSHSSAIFGGPRTTEASFLVKYVNGSLSPTRLRRKGRLFKGTIVFSAAGMVSSSWPSCLLSSCEHTRLEGGSRLQSASLSCLNREGLALSCCLSHLFSGPRLQ